MGYYSKRFWDDESGGIVTDGLKLWLDASNTASYPGTGTTWFDLSGNGNNGTMVNGVTPVSNAMSFDGVNDRVDLPSTTTFLVTSLPFTLSAWVNVSLHNPVYQTIFDLKTDTGAYAVFIGNSGNYLGLNFGSQSGWIRRRHATVVNYFTANWNNIAITYNGLGATLSENFKCYVNGMGVAVISGSTFGASVNTLNRIGARNDNSAQAFFNGSQNDHLIYNRELSASEALTNFNATKSKYGL